jgi:hypothetical protein
MAERPDDPQDEGLLARWSRRKRAAAKGEVTESPAATAEDEAQANLPAEQEPAELPELPDPETLDASSDFKPFLRPGVPAETQRAALRRLWRLDPLYNHMDGLDDYCEDYTDKATVVKGMRTAYRVGRGFLERAADAAAPAAEPVAANSAEDADQSERLAAAAGEQASPTGVEPPAPAPPATSTAEPEAPRRPRPLPRRG